MLTPVRFEGVYKMFDAEVAVENLNLSVEPGEFLVLVGPSGCGKTTTLRMLAGLERPTYGRVFIGERLVNNIKPRYRDIAMVFQSYALYPHMNVFDNLAFGMRAHHAKRSDVDQRVKETADILGLGQLLKRRPAELSGGQRQRVALGRALIRQPQVFLMDEPLSNLDAGLRVQMRAELSRLHRRFQVTTLYVTHDQVEAMTMGDRIAVMNGGSLQQVDVPETIYDNPANLFVAGFIGSPRMNFVRGSLRLLDGSPAVEFLGVTVPLKSKLTAQPEGDVTVGIRPEDLVWREAAAPNCTVTFDAEVDVVEPMGHEAYVTAVRSGETVISRFPPRSGVATHQRVELALNPARLHLFDAKTGQSVLERSVARPGGGNSTGGEAWARDAMERPSDVPGESDGRTVPSNEKRLKGGTA